MSLKGGNTRKIIEREERARTHTHTHTHTPTHTSPRARVEREARYKRRAQWEGLNFWNRAIKNIQKSKQTLTIVVWECESSKQCLRPQKNVRVRVDKFLRPNLTQDIVSLSHVPEERAPCATWNSRHANLTDSRTQWRGKTGLMGCARRGPPLKHVLARAACVLWQGCWHAERS